ncbi:MAG: hypothetical protein JSR46_12450 [Verrucomicrobia bacterium]|nr:hypothetical protein [Verrucomicrobiota bacterium]
MSSVRGATNGRRALIHSHLSHAADCIKQGNLAEAITHLEQNVPPSVINNLHGQVYLIEKAAGRITQERMHRDFGKVAFQGLRGWGMAHSDRIAAIQKVQALLPQILEAQQETPRSLRNREICTLRDQHSNLISKIQTLFDANSAASTDEAQALFRAFASDKSGSELKRAVDGLVALRDDEMRLLREWQKLDKLSEIHARAEAAYRHLERGQFEKVDDALFGMSPALLFAAYCKKYPFLEPYLYPFQLLTEIDIEAEGRALDNRSAIARDPLLSKDYDAMTNTCQKAEHAHLNAFNDIHIFDATLVPLRSGRFINANYTIVHDRAFIATQAPLPHTAHDFWQMVFEHKLKTIVSLNDCFDDIRQVIQYCPNEVGAKLQFGDVTVQLQEPITAVSDPDWKLPGRSHEHGIKHRKLLITRGDQAHELNHFQYLHWPDGHIPVEPCVMRLLDMVAESQGSDDVPMVVHCRAGVGRTGLFIVLYDQLMRLRAGLPLDVKQSVSDLRDPIQGRSLSMMQNLSQYQFAYQFLVQYMQGVYAPG